MSANLEFDAANKKNQDLEEISRTLMTTLTDAQKNEFRKTVKRGIYKELHYRGLITDTQLDQLLGQI